MRWAAAAIIAVIVVVGLGGWFIGALGWTDMGNGWERRLDLNLWPPSMCWVSRPMDEPNEIGEGDPPLLFDPARVECLLNP